jgi:gliding motility-associated-like protein
MNIEVTSGIIPDFALVGPICLNNTAPVLPAVSVNGITGNWVPATVNTGTVGTTNYTFTPEAGQCAVATTLAITISGPEITEIKVVTSTNGMPNGQATVNAQGNALPLYYSLDGTNWQNSEIFANLPAGTYTAWVKDANGCTTSEQFIILNTVTGDVGVLAGDVQSCINIPFEIPVMAYDFTNISAFTIQLAFDSSVLTYNGITQANDLLDGDFSSTFISPGILQISFLAADSITLLSEDLLLTLNFSGMATGISELQWNWLKCVIYSVNGYEIPAIYTKGSVEIRPAPQIYTEGSGTYCEGEQVKLGSGSLNGQNLTYNWVSPNGTQHAGQQWNLGNISASSGGEYHVMASDSTACSKTENLHVQVNPRPAISISEYDTLCAEQVFLLDPGTGFINYTWQDGSNAPQLETSAEGIYWVTVTDTNGCQGSDSVILIPCDINRSYELEIWWPNAFSPNGDGTNDVFEARYDSEVKITFQMLIFNKWGEQIFSSNDITKGWDGTFKGERCPLGMYTYVISFKAAEPYYFLQASPARGNVMLLK